MSRPSSFLFTIALALIASSAVAGAQDKSRVSPKSNSRPPAPTSVKAAITAEGTITVTWDAVRGATRYDIGRLDPMSGWRAVARVPGSSTEFVDQGLDLTQPRQYRIVAVVGDLASLPAMTEQVAQGLGGGTVGAAAATRTCMQPVWNHVRCSKRMQWTGALPRNLALDVGCPAEMQFVGGGYEGQLTGATIAASRPVIGYEGPIWVVSLTTREMTAEERSSRLTPYLEVSVLCRVG